MIVSAMNLYFVIILFYFILMFPPIWVIRRINLWFDLVDNWDLTRRFSHMIINLWCCNDYLHCDINSMSINLFLCAINLFCWWIYTLTYGRLLQIKHIALRLDTPNILEVSLDEAGCLAIRYFKYLWGCNVIKLCVITIDWIFFADKMLSSVFWLVMSHHVSI